MAGPVPTTVSRAVEEGETGTAHHGTCLRVMQ